MAGDYEVSASKDEYDFSDAQNVSLGPDQSGIDFTASLKNYQIAGKVTVDGEGLVGVAVSTGEASATTAADGTYAITGLVAGDYEVKATKARYSFDGPHALAVGPSKTDVDFVGSLNRHKLSGRVTVDGRGLSGATVGAAVSTSSSSGTGPLQPSPQVVNASSVTGPGGWYELDGLAEGEYEVSASLPGVEFEGPVTVLLDRDKDGIDFRADLSATGGKLRVKRRVKFGTVAVNSWRERVLVIRNVSKTDTLTVLIASTPGPPFSVVSGGGVIQLAPRSKHVVTLRFAPTGQGIWLDALELSSSDPRRPEVVVRLKGKGKSR